MFLFRCLILLMFQFQNGTIKRKFLKMVERPRSRFQFQNGTIKSIDFLTGMTSGIVFQFQNGTIKSFKLHSAVLILQ